MKGGNLLAIIAVTAMLAGCATTANFYPINPQAEKLGLLHATLHEGMLGAGTMTMTLPSGEVLKGQFSTVNGPSTAFGSGSASIGGITGGGFGSMVASPGSRLGFAELMGNKGTTAQCEFEANPWSHGSGLCKFSNGAEYRVMF